MKRKRNKNKKIKELPFQILRICIKLRRLDNIYLDSCLFGVYADKDTYKIQFTKLAVKAFKKFDIQPIVSRVTIQELEDTPEKLIRLIKKGFKEYNPAFLKIDEQDITKEIKKFYKFLKDLGIKENDALHYSVATLFGIHAFISFNKRDLIKYESKIYKYLLKTSFSAPEIFDYKEFYELLEDLEKHKII